MYNICTWPLKLLSIEINSNGSFVGVIDGLIVYKIKLNLGESELPPPR